MNFVHLSDGFNMVDGENLWMGYAYDICMQMCNYTSILTWHLENQYSVSPWGEHTFGHFKPLWERLSKCNTPTQRNSWSLISRAWHLVCFCPSFSVFSAEMRCENSKGESCIALEVKSKQQMSYNTENSRQLLCSTQMNRFIRHTLRSIYSQCQKTIHICYPFLFSFDQRTYKSVKCIPLSDGRMNRIYTVCVYRLTQEVQAARQETTKKPKMITQEANTWKV